MCKQKFPLANFAPPLYNNSHGRKELRQQEHIRLVIYNEEITREAHPQCRAHRNTLFRSDERHSDFLRQPNKAILKLDGAERHARFVFAVNTISRHRQEILGKLQVKNSIEACRIAKDLRLI